MVNKLHNISRLTRKPAENKDLIIKKHYMWNGGN